MYVEDGERAGRTGAMVKLTLWAARMPENVVVIVAVVFSTWIKAVAARFNPPPEQVEKPRKSMNCCWPPASR